MWDIEESQMLLPARVVQITEALYGLNINLARGSDNDRRKLTRMIAEQVCFELGNQWGTKAQSPTHPQSKDAIAYNLGGGLMDVWDWQNGTTREPQLRVNEAPDYPSLSGQFFISVTPTNHLEANPPDTEPLPDTEVKELLEIISRDINSLKTSLDSLKIDLDVIERDTADILRKCQQILDKPTPEIELPQPPDYELKMFGRTIGTFKPKTE